MSSGFVRCSKKPSGRSQDLAREIRTDVGLERYGPGGSSVNGSATGRTHQGWPQMSATPPLVSCDPKTFILLGPAEVSRVRGQHEQTAPRYGRDTLELVGRLPWDLV